MTKLALIVDDNGGTAAFIAECMERMGYQCICKRTFEAAMDTVYDANLEVAIIDIFLPGMGGIEGIKRLKAINDNCRILAVSGGFQPMTGLTALKAAQRIGADAVLPKPFRLHEIREVIAGFTANGAKK